MCSKKLTGSQLSLPHRINKKLKCETKNKMKSCSIYYLNYTNMTPKNWNILKKIDKSQQLLTSNTSWEALPPEELGQYQLLHTERLRRRRSIIIGPPPQPRSSDESYWRSSSITWQTTIRLTIIIITIIIRWQCSLHQDQQPDINVYATNTKITITQLTTAKTSTSINLDNTARLHYHILACTSFIRSLIITNIFRSISLQD